MNSKTWYVDSVSYLFPIIGKQIINQIVLNEQDILCEQKEEYEACNKISWLVRVLRSIRMHCGTQEDTNLGVTIAWGFEILRSNLVSSEAYTCAIYCHCSHFFRE